MQRVLVIGSGGAGKSTFATRLAELTGLPLIHLDTRYWKPGWREPPKEEWGRVVGQLIREAQWIIDGNYAGTLEQRLAACDTVIFLDMSGVTCLRRVIWRWVRFRGRARPDMTHGCPERLTWEFVRWIWRYSAESRPHILRRLSALRPDQRAVVLHSRGEVDAFFRALSAQA
jgi:adenylate kinase family enzyme